MQPLLSLLSLSFSALILANPVAFPDRPESRSLTQFGLSRNSPNPPNVPGPKEGRKMLKSIKRIEVRTNEKYNRDHFVKSWDDQGDSCNTREIVLQRDGTNVRVNDRCASISGSWYSLYDGRTITNDDDIQIDHVVALSHAFEYGAWEWDKQKKREFGNDLKNPELLAVSGTSNSKKSNLPPQEWKPPMKDAWCLYALMWIKVKFEWKLTAEAEELTELANMLDTCPGEQSATPSSLSEAKPPTVYDIDFEASLKRLLNWRGRAE